LYSTGIAAEISDFDIQNISSGHPGFPDGKFLSFSKTSWPMPPNRYLNKLHFITLILADK